LAYQASLHGSNKGQIATGKGEKSKQANKQIKKKRNTKERTSLAASLHGRYNLIGGMGGGKSMPTCIYVAAPFSLFLFFPYSWEGEE